MGYVWPKRGEPMCACFEGYMADQLTGMSCIPIPGAPPPIPPAEESRFSAEDWGITSMTLSMTLTKWQLQELSEAGITLGPKEQEVAQRMAKRGFSSNDFVRALVKYRTYIEQYPELANMGKDSIEDIASGMVMGLSERDLWYAIYETASGRTDFASYYNRHITNYRTLVIAGGVVTGIGASSLLAGLMTAREQVASSEEKEFMVASYGIIGLVALTAGIPTLLVGISKRRYALPADFQEQPIDQYRVSSTTSPVLPENIVLFPHLENRGFGIDIGATF